MTGFAAHTKSPDLRSPTCSDYHFALYSRFSPLFYLFALLNQAAPCQRAAAAGEQEGEAVAAAGEVVLS
jgi:hypothetical protein